MSSLITAEIKSKADELYHGDEICQQKAKQLLSEISLPNGLLPLKDVEECGIIRETGFVWLKQKKSYTHKFEKIGKLVSYAPEITAIVEKGKIKKLTGVKTKELLVWVQLSDIYVDDPPTGKITFKTPAGLFRTFLNVASMMEPWAFRPNTFADSWISDAFSRDTKTLTMALQKSLSGNNPEPLDSSSADFFMPFLNTIAQTPEAAPTPTVSGLSGSDDLDSAAAPLKRQQRNAIPVANGSGKVSKRKSRASKRSQTTFITADPSNFRQMVQQVTGVRFGNGQVTMPSVLKPEPQRHGSRLAGGVGLCMPTLDTSAYLLDQPNQEPQLAGPISTRIATGPGPNTTLTGSGPVSFGSTGGVDVAPGGAVGHGYRGKG